MSSRRPLSGFRVVVTRPQPGPGERDPFVRLLRDAGAAVTAFPAIALEPPRSWAPVDRAIRALREPGRASSRLPRRGPAATAGYDWIVFLSANAVDRFLGRVRRLGAPRRLAAACRLAAIGPATARALRRRGLRPDAVASEATSEGLSAALCGRIGRGDRVLLPRTDIGRDVLPGALRRRGAAVDEVTVYRTVPARGPGVARLRRALARGAVDAVAFASAQTVRSFAAAVGRQALRRMSPSVRVAAIGPVTASACRAAGLRVDAEARTPSFRALADAIARVRGRP